MSSITPDLAEAFSAARTLDCPLCPAVAGDGCIYSTALVSMPVVPGTQGRKVLVPRAVQLVLARQVNGQQQARVGARGDSFRDELVFALMTVPPHPPGVAARDSPGRPL
jgi:hypothetical protein